MINNKVYLFLALIYAVTQGVRAQFPNPFLSEKALPDGTQWLPKPPSITSGEFYNDLYFYQWGKDMRNGETGEKALWDESAELYQVFTEAMGITLSYKSTPEILFLAEAATSDANASSKALKNYYERLRPFVTLNEPSLKPEEDEKKYNSFCYPSGHAARGWMFALVLATIAPERTEALMSRAYEYALNRVICGHHWKSDIDAALMLTAGLFANVVATESYQQQLVKAKAEYALVKEQPISMPFVYSKIDSIP